MNMCGWDVIGMSNVFLFQTFQVISNVKSRFSTRKAEKAPIQNECVSVCVSIRVGPNVPST